MQEMRSSLGASDAIVRGYNLLGCAALTLAGFAFGSVLIPEKDLPDKIDDAAFLVIGLVALVWYLSGENRFKLSRLPNLLCGLAVIMQIVGVVIEHSDKEAFGDNIGGMILFVPLFILLWVQFGKTRSLAGREAPSPTPRT